MKAFQQKLQDVMRSIHWIQCLLFSTASPIVSQLVLVVLTAFAFSCSVNAQHEKLQITPKSKTAPSSGVDGTATQEEDFGNQAQLSPQIPLPEIQISSPVELKQLAVDLSADDFQTRKAASLRLKSLSAVDLGTLARELIRAPSAEALVRIHSELESRYESNSKVQQIQASKVLEEMAVQDRLLSADHAIDTLQKNWEKRTEVALAELEQLGAIVKNGRFSHAMGQGLQRSFHPSRQVLITKSWTGGDAGLEIFRRLETLTGPLTQTGDGLFVFLLSDHSLTTAQQRTLHELVGSHRIQERSVVALGVTSQAIGRGMYEGVQIERVSDGGSADKAGLKAGDFLLSMYGPGEKVRPMKYDPDSWRIFGRNIQIPPPPAEDGDEADTPPPAKNKNRLVDFDQLVERLKKYQPGDKVTLQVVRGFQPTRTFGQFPPPPRGDDQRDQTKKVVEIEVELMGWADLPIIP